MTIHEHRQELPDTAELKARFQPLFDRIAENAIRRESDRVLLHEEISWLKDSGFTALRVPAELGGAGASLPQFFDLLIDLAAADTNIVQALRGHFTLIEDRLVAPRAEGEPWLRRFAAGEIAGNGWTEVGEVKLGDTITKVRDVNGDFRVDGQKYYSTGTIYADWIDVFATRADDGAPVIALVAANQPGVDIRDDWTGFGQRLTGTGTTIFTDARAEAVFPFETRFRYQTAYYQLVLNAVLTGAALAAVRQVGKLVAGRKRAFSHGNGEVRFDPQLLQVVGKARAFAYASRAATIEAARAAQHAFETSQRGDKAADDAANIQAELQSAEAQVAAVDLTLRAVTDVFDALSASSTDQALALDRHWRNARTAASHNPVVYKQRILGDHTVNGTEPIYVWQIGAVRS